MKTSYFLIGAVLFFLGAVIISSPVQWNATEQAYVISSQQIIDRPVCQVYDYLTDSGKAKNWSVFVEKIEVLNPEIRDGEVGSRRICFANSFPAGASWKEETVVNDACQKRRLTIYDLQNFPVVSEGLYTDQLYRQVDEGKSELKLVLYLPWTNFYEAIKFKCTGAYISGIFSRNLKQIKKEIEDENEV